METKKVRIAVIGGGAAGLCCAVRCARHFGKGSTLIIERQPRTGRKLLATGNGRCNITNRNVSLSHYHGDKRLIRAMLSRFTADDCEHFFRQLGILLRDEDGGRVYPYSNRATTVLDCLRLACVRSGAEELCGFQIRTIRKSGRQFISQSDNIRVISDYLVFATGSAAAPQLGADDSGFRLLEDSFGILSTPRFPALAPVNTKEHYSQLKGVRAKGTVTLLGGDKRIQTSKGEIQFTEKGLSGICVFDLSRYVNEFFALGTVNGKQYRRIRLSVDVMQEFSHEELCAYLHECKKIFADEKAAAVLSGALDKKLSQTIADDCRLSTVPCRTLDSSSIERLAYSAKNLLFTPIASDDLRSAQVCAGGIDSTEVAPDTLMSYRVENLYICGELLDADGECGGYNLHLAFAGAHTAADAIISGSTGI